MNTTNRKNIAKLISAFAFLWTSSLCSQAAFTTLRFSGEVDVVGSNLSPYFQVGDDYTFNVTFDTNAPNIKDSVTYLVDSYYNGETALLSINATGGPFDVAVTNPRFQPENGPGFDRYSIFFNAQAFAPQGIPATTFSVANSNLGSTIDNSLFNPQLSLFDPNGTALSSLDLPATLDRSDWSALGSQSNINMFFNSGTSNDQLRLNVADITTVPEPSSGLLTGLGGLALLMRRRRQ